MSLYSRSFFFSFFSLAILNINPDQKETEKKKQQVKKPPKKTDIFLDLFKSNPIKPSLFPPKKVHSEISHIANPKNSFLLQ